MKRNRLVLSIMMLLLAALILWLWPRRPKAKLPEDKRTVSLSPQETLQTSEEYEARQQEKKKGEIVGQIITSLGAPIELYGKVVDQNGEPVSNVRVGYSLLDKFNESGSSSHKFSDNAGRFEISSVKGAVITVKVTKDGYYQIPDVSYQSFAYGYGADAYTKPPPTKDNPAVFVLHKMGETEPLVMFEYRSFRIPKDGTPVTVDLDTGRASNTGQIQVQAWTDDQPQDARNHYDWKCRVSVPGGGLIERKNQFDFKAPSKGYKEFDEVSYEKDTKNWRNRFNKEYFSKFPDGTYARFKISFTTGGTHFFHLESYHNPAPGSRNLEYDPKQAVKVP